MTPLETLAFADAPERFLDLLSRRAWEGADAVSFPLGARYLRAYFGAAWQGDASLLLHAGGRPRALLRAQAIDGCLCDNGQGATFAADAEVPAGVLLAAAAAAARRFGCARARLAVAETGGATPELARLLLLHRAVPRLRFEAEADLGLEPQALRRALRSSYRSLVNWGMHSLSIAPLDAACFDAARFESFRLFHIATAGRKTRSAESWAIQAEMIRAGAAVAMLAELPGHGLVAANLLLHEGHTSTYGVGVYERSLFARPLAHAPLFAAMLLAKARGSRRFLLGVVPPAGAASDKECAIGFFKSGFATHLRTLTEWDLAVPAEGAR